MKKIFGSCLLGCLAIFTAAADPIIDFDDIAIPVPSNSVVSVPLTYHGLSWTGFGVLDGKDFSVSPSGYQAGVVSTKNVISPTNGNLQVSMTGSITGGLFDLLSVNATGSIYDNLNLEVKGFINGTLVYDTNYTLNAINPTLLQVNYYGVTEVDFISSGGSQHPGYVVASNESFVLDDITVKVYDPALLLIKNGGFESGNFTNWSLLGVTNNTGVSSLSPYVHSGADGAFFGPSNTPTYLQQTVKSLIAGQAYQLSYWLGNSVGGTPNEFIVNWGGQTILDQSNLPAFGFTNYQMTVVPNGPRAKLQLGFRNDHQNFGLDDVSITPVPLVQNGGFEARTFTNWAQSGNSDGNIILTSPSFARTGQYGACFGAVGSLGLISQTLNTIPGQSYLVSFWLNKPGTNAPSNEFAAYWNGQTLVDITNLGNKGWTNLHYVVLATSPQTTLTFGGSDDPDYIALDEITVRPVPLIANGDFETGDFTGWTTSGNFDSTDVVADPAYRTSGFYGVQAGPPVVPGFLSQTVTTIPGQTYLLSCQFADPSGFAPNSFQVSWNGTSILNLTNQFSTNFVNPQFLVTATSTSTPIKFGFVDTPSYLALDEVTLQPFGGLPGFQSVNNSGGQIHFSFGTLPGYSYQIQYTTNLTTWINLGTPFTNSTTTATASDTLTTGAGGHFYRVAVQPPSF